MKYAGLHFGKEIMPCMGLEEPVRVAPAEIIELEIRQMYEDFNYEMRDNSWAHFEFQSSDGGIDDLRRFRQYEANVSSAYGVAVTTYVVYTGNVKNPVTSITEGVNTYRIVPILMGEKDGDQVIDLVEEKLRTGSPLKRQELVPLVLTPLMAGKDSIASRIKKILVLLTECEKKEYEDLCQEDLKKMEAVVYAFANKFLNPSELEEVEEVLNMSILGQRIFEDGFEKGMEKSLNNIIAAMLSRNKTVEEIHADTDIPVNYIQAVKNSLNHQDLKRS